MNLKDYTDKYSQLALAKAIGAAPSFVNQWIKKRRPVPPAYCMAIERATNGLVTRQELCKDWQRIWPDLVAPSKAPRKSASGA